MNIKSMNLIYQSIKLREPRRHFFRLLSLKIIILGLMLGIMAKIWIFLVVGLGVFLFQFVFTAITINCPTCFEPNTVEKRVAFFNCRNCGSSLGLNKQNAWVPVSEAFTPTSTKTKIRQKLS